MGKRTLAAMCILGCWCTSASGWTALVEPRYPREGEEVTIHVGAVYPDGCYYVAEHSWSRSGNDFRVDVVVDHPWNHGEFVACADVMAWVGVAIEVGALEAGTYTVNGWNQFEVLPPGIEPPRVVSVTRGSGRHDYLTIDELPETLAIEFSKPLAPMTVNEQTFRLLRTEPGGRQVQVQLGGLALVRPMEVHIGLAEDMPNGRYCLVADGDPDGLSVRDLDGMALDGEPKRKIGCNSGVPGYECWNDFPTGNRVPGGDFTLTFDVQVSYHTIAVKAHCRNAPLEGIRVDGATPGVVPYSFTIPEYEYVHVVAPELAVVNGVEYRFKEWGCWQYGGGRELYLPPSNVPRELIAEWSVAGDATRDGVVDICDLVAVREKMGKDPASAYWDVDANRDGSVNILDLIFVRNRLGARAPTQ